MCYYLSHAYHICGRFLNGYLRNGRMYYPDFGIAGMYVEQTKEGDLSREPAGAQASQAANERYLEALAGVAGKAPTRRGHLLCDSFVLFVLLVVNFSLAVHRTPS